ncbi:hypothetical protein BSZ28_19715 [Pseudomonas moraviensis]|nr:hypothetical protein BSZ28_19715 [Pseudomonas moraviensis]
MRANVQQEPRTRRSAACLQRPQLRTAYARWLNSSTDWGELEKLQIGTQVCTRHHRPALTH